MFKPHIHLVGRLSLTALVTTLVACAPIAQPTSPPPSVVPTATQNIQATQAAQNTQTAQTAVAVEAAQNTQAAQTEAVQAAQSTAQAATALAATQAYNLTATPARATKVAANRQATRVASTATAVAGATQQAQSMYEQVQSLNADGYIKSTEGVYHAIPYFFESWAQLGWYRYWHTDFAPKNFVLRTDASWKSGSDRADWWSSGCGFVFREESPDNHYLIYLGLDGRVYLTGFKRGIHFRVGNAYYAPVDYMEGQANLMLIVEDNKFTFFVDGERVYTATDNSFGKGDLALTLLSGTNKDFGTRCRMANIELWELK